MYRCKGVVHSAEAPLQRSVLQVVGRRVDISLERDWADQEPGTRIVVIGASHSLDGENLPAMFDGCQSSNMSLAQ